MLSDSELTIAILIHAAIPLLGLIFFLILLNKTQKENTQNISWIALFLIFLTYGTLLIMVLTVLLWKWSGMTSLSSAYLLIGAPIIMGIIAYKNYKNRHLSKYHKWVYRSGISYFLIAPLIAILLMVFE
tara:strand:+ start:594 stop:980 length:387 start_codon:yes stop_codon:yes gene_type:complete